jgi:hypothetical protein
MRPTFGCSAPNYVFAPGSVMYLNLLQSSISEAITYWEPRVDVLSVVAEADSTDPSQVTVSVSCRVRATNSPLNLVFPYYLGMTEET